VPKAQIRAGSWNDLIAPRDTCWPEPVRTTLTANGIDTLYLPFQSSNRNMQVLQNWTTVSREQDIPSQGDVPSDIPHICDWTRRQSDNDIHTRDPRSSTSAPIDGDEKAIRHIIAIAFRPVVQGLRGLMGESWSAVDRKLRYC